MAAENNVNIEEANFAGVWIRLVALIIDGLLLAPFSAPAAFIGFKAGLQAASDAAPGEKVTVVLSADDKRLAVIFGVVGALASATYFILLNSSKWQGSVGKRVLGLKIVDHSGARISRGIAAKRYFAQNWAGLVANVMAIGNPVGSAVQMMNNLSGIYFVVNAIIGGTDVKKRTIHDRVAGTYVVSTKS